LAVTGVKKPKNTVATAGCVIAYACV
jgi:hypothetical protein